VRSELFLFERIILYTVYQNPFLESLLIFAIAMFAYANPSFGDKKPNHTKLILNKQNKNFQLAPEFV
jgi:hypothetical protein